jgi:drug/metabolite transporter (DMT)-like permease
MQGNNTLAHLSVILLNLLYALSYFVLKKVSPEYLPASTFVLIRVISAGSLFWIAASFTKGKPIEKQDHIKLFIAALFGVVFNQLCFFNGLVYTSSINTSIIMTTTPILVLPISAWWIKERVSGFKIIGIIIGFLGALIVILQRDAFDAAPNPLKGNILIFINAALFSFYLVYSKPIMVKYSLFEVLKWTFLYGAIILLPFGLPELSEVDWDFPSEIWWSIAYVIIVITFFTFILNMYAIKRLPPSAVSTYIFSQPLMVSILTFLFEGTPLTLQGGLAYILIFVGVYFVAIKKS